MRGYLHAGPVDFEAQARAGVVRGNTGEMSMPTLKCGGATTCSRFGSTAAAASAISRFISLPISAIWVEL